MATLFGACVLERVGGAEESSVFTDPDTDLAAIGILGDFWVDVRGDHQDTHNIRRFVRDRPIPLRAARQRQHVTLIQLARPVWRCDRRSSSQHHEEFVAGVMEVTPIIASWVDLPNRRAKPIACSYEFPRADSAPVWNVVPDVGGIGHPAFILAGTRPSDVTTSPCASVRECHPICWQGVTPRRGLMLRPRAPTVGRCDGLVSAYRRFRSWPWPLLRFSWGQQPGAEVYEATGMSGPCIPRRSSISVQDNRRRGADNDRGHTDEEETPDSLRPAAVYLPTPHPNQQSPSWPKAAEHWSKRVRTEAARGGGT